MDVSQPILRSLVILVLIAGGVNSSGQAQTIEPSNPLRRATMNASPVVGSWSTGQVAAAVDNVAMPQSENRSTANHQLIEQTPPEIRRILFPDEPVTDSGASRDIHNPETIPAQTAPASTPIAPPRHDDRKLQASTTQLPSHAAQPYPFAEAQPHDTTRPATVDASSGQPAHHSDDGSGSYHIDGQVAPVTYNTSIDSPPNPANDLLARIRQRTGADETDKGPGQVTDLLQRVATYTSLVLVLGVGFLVMLKKWINRPTGDRPLVDSDKIQIKSTLKLSPKASVHLLQTGSHRFVVATDATGIQNVMLLGTAFQDTLEQFGPFYERDESGASTGPHTPTSAASDRTALPRQETDSAESGATQPHFARLHDPSLASAPPRPNGDDGATPRDFAKTARSAQSAASARDALRDVARQQTTDPKIHDLLDRLKDGEIKNLIQQSLQELG